MCIVSSGDITWGMKDNNAILKDEIKVEKLGNYGKEQIDRNYNVVLLGDTKVGKTQILNKHVNGSFDDRHRPTTGFEFMNQKYKSTINAGNKIIQLHIVDTPGQEEKYKTPLPDFAKDAQAIILVYDITNEESFNNIKYNWLGCAKGHAHGNTVYFLVCNKADLKKKGAVTEKEAKEYAKEKNMQFFEVSAMKGDNVDKLFEDIVKECLIKDKDAIQNNKCCSCCPCNK